MVKDWPMVLIGDILDFKNGLNKGKEYFGYGTPIVNYTDVYHHSGLYASDIKGSVSLSKDEIKRFEVRKNDVFFTRTSETPEEVGLSAVLLEDIPDCAFSGFVLRGRPKNDILVPEYCKYCFSAKAVREKIISNCTYTTRALTNGRVLSSIEIPIPPKEEQIAIARALTDMEQHISDLAELIEKKKAIRDGALEDLLSGRTRLAGFTEPWREMRLDQFTDINPKTTIPDTFMYVDLESVVGIDLISPRRENASTAPSRARRYASKGDVFYQTVRPYQKNNYLFDMDGDYVFSTGYAQLRTDNDYHYLFLLIRLDSFVNKVLDNCTGTSYPAINPTRLGEIPVFVPVDRKEQKAIADVLTAMDEEIKDLEDERNKMIQIREGAMDDLLTGRVRL